MDNRQKRTLGALAMMVDQHLEKTSDNFLDSIAISACEHAISALAEYGYMEEIIEGRIFGRWTEAGEELLAWAYPFDEQQNKLFPLPNLDFH